MNRHNLEQPQPELQKEKLKLPSSSILIEGLRNLTNYLLTNVNVTFSGTENLQGIDSPIIFAVAPHNGHMDSLFARRAIGRTDRNAKKKAIFIAAGDGFWDKQPRKTMSQMAVRPFTISREGGTQTQKNKKQVEKIIRQGNNLVLFPEGTRSRDPHKKIVERDFKTGAAQWAIATRDLDTVIVPIFMQGTEQIMPPGRGLPKFRESKGQKKFSVNITIGKPIHVASYIPDNFENMTEKDQYVIIKQVTALIQAFMIAQEKYIDHDHREVVPY
jgi:1-acyl-sn-glycerol-3-phosphate acyltransferase